MRLTKLFLLFAIAPAGTNPAQSVSVDGVSVDCSWVKDAPSCSSFVTMLKAKDEDILDAIPATGSHKKTFTCFRPAEDTFLIVSFRLPTYFHKNGKTGASTAQSAMTVRKYSNGMESNYLSPLIFVTWEKVGDSIFGHAAGTASHRATADITSTEIEINGSFTNALSKTTMYRLQIRQSTLRFVETFGAEKDQQQVSGVCLLWDDTE